MDWIGIDWFSSMIDITQEQFDRMKVRLAAFETLWPMASAGMSLPDEDAQEIVTNNYIPKVIHYSVVDRCLALDKALVGLIEAADCIRHWHDTGRENEGMIVSNKHVRLLWDEIVKARMVLNGDKNG